MDIVDSTRSKDRNDLTNRLNKAISESNRDVADSLFAPFEITKGDEVAAILHSVSPVYDVITLFSEALYPDRMRIIIVFDKLTAGLDSKRSAIIDGPAFYRANDKMIQLKKTQKIFSVDSSQSNLDTNCDAMTNLVLQRFQEMTTLQRKMLRLYQKDKNQTKVAQKLNRTQQQVQQALSTCKWELIDNAEKSIRDLLRQIDQKNKTGGIRE